MGDEAEIAEQLAALQRGYAGKLRARLDRLRADIARARHGDQSALEDAAREAHKLHGTAGSYGFAEVSEALGKIEVALEQMLATGAETPDDWDAVLHALGRALDTPALAPSGGD
jgi:HPt (histidine-containing phosphotransfer) domain-containing protein